MTTNQFYSHWSNPTRDQTQVYSYRGGRERLATDAAFLRSGVAQALSRRDGPDGPATLRCITASIMKISFCFYNFLLRVFPSLAEIAQKKGKMSKSAAETSPASLLLTDSLLGNSHAYLVASVGGRGE